MSKSSYKPKDKSAPFNMSMLFYIRLNEAIAEKDSAFFQGDVVAYFKSLKIIYRAIIFKIPTTIKTKGAIKNRSWFEEAFSKVKSLFSSSGVSGRAAELQSDLNYSRAMDLLEEVDNELTFVMDAYDMIFPDIEMDGKGLEYLDRRYSLK